MAQAVKNLSAMQETWVQSLGWEDPPEEGMAIHSSILAWRIPWTEASGPSSWGRKESGTTDELSLSLSCQPCRSAYVCSVMSNFSQPHVACQDPWSMGFPRPEYWNRLPFLTPGI